MALSTRAAANRDPLGREAARPIQLGLRRRMPLLSKSGGGVLLHDKGLCVCDLVAQKGELRIPGSETLSHQSCERSWSLVRTGPILLLKILRIRGSHTHCFEIFSPPLKTSSWSKCERSGTNGPSYQAEVPCPTVSSGISSMMPRDRRSSVDCPVSLTF